VDVFAEKRLVSAVVEPLLCARPTSGEGTKRERSGMNEQLSFIQQQQLNQQSVSGQDYAAGSGSLATLAVQQASTLSQAAGRGPNAQGGVPSQLGAMMMLNGALGGSQRTLWIGDLAPWMDEAFLYSLFSPTNQLLSVKLIRNKTTGLSEGYAFLEMKSHDAAEQVLQACNGRPIPGASDMVFRLNWAAYGVGKTSQPSSDDHSLFVGDLAPDVSDLILQEYFRQFYPSVRSAKVITDVATGRSKGYGFVRFSAENERNLALTTMNGHFLSNRPIRVSLATAKKNVIVAQQPLSQPHPSDLDPTNTTLFIGGLSSQVVEEQLRAVFGQFGDIIYVKIPQGKGCGFVQFVLRASAEQAMAAMNGRILGNSAMRISWGRSSSRSASQPGQGMAGIGVGGYGGVPNGIDSHVLDQMMAASAAAAGYATNPQPSLVNGSALIQNQYLSSFAKASLPLDLPADIFSAYMYAQHAATRNVPVNVSDEDADTGLTSFSRGMSTGGVSGRTDDSGFEHREGSLEHTGAKDSARTSTEVESLQDVSNASHPDSNCGSYVEPGTGTSSPQKDGQYVDQLTSRDSATSHDMTPLFANLVM